MPLELDPKYDPTKVEKKWYPIWEEAGVFNPDYSDGNATKGTYSIVIPPPNVTGQLHVGHALNHTIQDVLTRAARKRGFKTLWLPGTDHAGIATQTRVEINLQETEGKSRHDYGREKFLEKVWDWKGKYHGEITNQIRKMGQSVDWSRERFTMDEGLSEAVRKVFVDLYRDGKIYRAARMVNWDPVAHTVLSDLEVEHDENHKGELYSFAYPLTDGSGEIVVATTRPETMLGDTAVAVHPDDERYKKLIGKTVKHPFIDREIKIIADAILVDSEFGSGAVKITPAHDMNDFETGKRHDLELINIFDESANINENGGRFAGMDRFKARKEVKKALAEAGLERGVKDHMMSLGKSQRSLAIVEPIVSSQWFVDMKPLAEPAIKAVEDGTVTFVPKQWEKTYFNWMRNIRDWCISRQLWWGHRIPAWYGPDDEIFVEMSEADALAAAEKHYGKKVELRQDEDVLDTWFSSGLWPFSTMGWPEKTKDLEDFYPNTVLVTGFDIIFFWIARMMVFGYYCMGREPFKHIYITGLMRDENGLKMSKTKGNVVDPLLAVDKFGADAFRFFLMATITEGKDARYSEDRLKGYQNFTNKVWNSTRFLFMNLPDDFEPEPDNLLSFQLEQEDYWVLEQLNLTIETMEKNFDEYKFHIATDQIYSFVWNIYCDWYIELIKPRMFGKTGEESTLAARQTAFYVLRSMLGLLHPFMPFITEEIYDAMNSNWKTEAQTRENKYLVTRPWPETIQLDDAARKQARGLELIQEVISGTRTIRSEANVQPGKKVKLIIRSKSDDLSATVASKEQAILRLAQAETIAVDADYKPAKTDASDAFSEGEIFLPLEGLLDIEKETNRLKGEIAKLEKQTQGIEKKLSNQGFLDKAPDEVVAKEKEKLAEMGEKIEKLKGALARFGGE